MRSEVNVLVLVMMTVVTAAKLERFRFDSAKFAAANEFCDIFCVIVCKYGSYLLELIDVSGIFVVIDVECVCVVF